MQSEEQRLIEGLFQRLKQAEQQAGPRDAGADRQIQEFVRQQPSAPYYMAQSMLIQEAALKRLHQQVQQLESQVRQLEGQVTELRNAPSSGGFLSNLFGGGNRARQQQPAPGWSSQQQAPGYGAPQTPPPGYNGYAQPQAAPSRAGGFMSGALQTAAGVAGGVVLADMLTNMFHHSQPQEIVNIIEEPMSGAGVGADDLTQHDFQNENLDTFNDVSGSHFLDQDGNSLGGSDYNSDDRFLADDNSYDNSFGADDDFTDDDDFV